MNLGKAAISGSFWTTITSITKALTQVLRLSILTRFLEKSDFGLIAIITVVIGFTQIFIDVGVSVALFSQDNLTKKQKSSLYWTGIFLAVTLYLITLIATPFVASFYEMPELTKLIPLAALDLIILSTAKQFRVYKQKDLKFKQISLIDISSLFASLLIELLLVYEGFGVYSLVFSTLVSSIISSVLILVTTLKEHPLTIYFNFKENSKIYKIGIYQTGAQMFDYFSSQLDVLIIGKLLGSANLGVYNLTKQLVLRLYGLIVPIFSSVTIPVFAKIKNSIKEFKYGYTKGLYYINWASCAIFGCLALMSKNLLALLYGSEYDQYSSLLILLCIWAVFSSVTSLASTVVIIFGRTEIGFKWTIVRVVFNTMFIFLGAYYSILGIVVAQVLFAVIFYLVYWKIVVNKIANYISIGDYAVPILTNIVKCIVTISIFVYAINTFGIKNWFLELLLTLIWLVIYTYMNRNFLNPLLLFRRYVGSKNIL